VVTLHGGGFMEGSRKDQLSYETAGELCHRGFAVVNIDYRLGLKGLKLSLPTVLRFGSLMQRSIDMAAEDLARAIDYLFRHADELDINPYKIVVAGSSAGAIAALQLGYYIANSVLNQVTRALPRINRVPLRPAAIVSYSGAILSARGAHHEDPIPTMLYHGLKDKLVPSNMLPCLLTRRLYGSERLHKEFKQHEGVFRTTLFAEAWHEVSLLLPKSAEQFCGFVDDVFAGKNDHSLSVSLRGSGIKPDEEWKKNIVGLLKDKSSQKESPSS
jgi:predicted esterase